MNLQDFYEFRLFCALAVAVGDVVVEDLLEFLDDIVAAQSGVELAVNVYRGYWVFKSAG